MKKPTPGEFAIVGIGVVGATGIGKEALSASLLRGEHRFSVMQREGRQHSSQYLGAEIPALTLAERFAHKVRSASLTAKAALQVVGEAWIDADLDDVDPSRIGLIVGGSNVQQRELQQVHSNYRERVEMLRPSYGYSFMDTDLCGICTEAFNIRGVAMTVGGASASGQLAIIQAAQQIAAGEVDVCIAMGALMDLSYWECGALRGIGAMGSDRFSAEPELACRPFDMDADGFIYGECSGALVVERTVSAQRRRRPMHGLINGWGISIDANRYPDPSLQGEKLAIEGALRHAGLSAADIDYINPHGTGSATGDRTELAALRECGLSGAYINTTKSLLGHGLTAAGAVEVIATLLQMKAGQLHPSRNLIRPVDDSFNWVGAQSITHEIGNALTMSMGFGGINTALCLERGE